MTHNNQKPGARRELLRSTAVAFVMSAAFASASLAQGSHLLHPENAPADDMRGGTLVVGLHIPMTHPIGAVASGLRNIPGTQLNAGLIRMSDDYVPVPYLVSAEKPPFWSLSRLLPSSLTPT